MVIDAGTGGEKNGISSKDSVQTRKQNYLNFGEEDQVEIFGYQPNNLKNFFTWTFYVFTLGILRLIFHWFPHWKLFATHSPCLLQNAENVLIVDNYKGRFKTYFVKKIQELRVQDSPLQDGKKLMIFLCDGSKKFLSNIRVIKFKKLVYVWDDQKSKFLRLSGMEKNFLTQDFHGCPGHTKTDQSLMRIPYGTNEINVPVQSIVTLLVLEALTPFYIFQVFSLLVWFAEAYYYYTIAIVVMSLVGISTSIIQTRRNQMNLKGTVHTIDKVQVKRGSRGFEEIPTTDLVPGDVIVIPANGCEMQCDAVLLNGNCIVNESMLTGESVPVLKTALPNNSKIYNSAEHSNHTLFCGTRVIQTRYYGNENVLAVVTRTGYLTAKGQLVRSIMYPPPADFKFDQDSYKFITILAVIAILCCIYTIFSKYSRNINGWDIIIKALDVITIAIPPALPAAMTVGKLYALNRLKKNRIYCINSRVINVSGSVDCICFDKTGTLTEDGLDMWGVIPAGGCPVKDVKQMPNEDLLFQGMLVCHSLTLVDGELCGDPLDVKMFESTNWVLEEPEIPDSSKYDLLVPTIVKPETDSEKEIGVIHQYQFSSTLQRMSVISKRLGSEFFQVFCKGSPEMIMSLSRPGSVPAGTHEQLKEYAQQGYRVIGMGTKKIDDVPFHKINKLHREDVECDLQFAGLIILENRLKPETKPVIDVLRRANLKIVMITGDNIQTAVSVARECGILPPHHSVIDVQTTKPTKFDPASIQFHEMDLTGPSHPQESKYDIDYLQRLYHFVVTGTTWEDLTHYFPDLIPKIITKGAVFARMSGHQKQQLIEELQNLGYYVAMCGDGANDCGALKAAHVGVSLSEAESSVASPFTSREPNISCTTKVIKEGRAALVTSFGVFKLMLCYSLTELASVMILYAIDSNLTSQQFLFIDICLVLFFASFFGKTKSYEKLHDVPPMTSLLSFVPLTSILLFLVITIGFQLVAFYYIQTFDWFTPFVFDSNQTTSYSCYENYAVFASSMFQYITMAVVFSKGKPYRKPIYTNFIFCFALILMTVICCYITLIPAQWVIDVLELEVPPEFGKIMILVIAVAHFILSFLVEEYLVDNFVYKVIKPRLKRPGKFRKYLRVEEELKGSIWPCTGEVITGEKNGTVNKGFDGIEVTQF